MAVTFFDLRCPLCRGIQENVQGVIGVIPLVECPTDGTPLRPYHGKKSVPYVGYGERPHHDDFERFRFQNLSS